MDLKELDPVSLLKFLKDIHTIHNISINGASIEDEGKEWRKVTVDLNNYNYEVTIPMDWLEAVGSIFYYDHCNRAYETLAFMCFERMSDWLECIYEDWVKNDTGRKISRSFYTLLEKEIERINNLLKMEEE